MKYSVSDYIRALFGNFPCHYVDAFFQGYDKDTVLDTGELARTLGKRGADRVAKKILGRILAEVDARKALTSCLSALGEGTLEFKSGSYIEKAERAKRDNENTKILYGLETRGKVDVFYRHPPASDGEPVNIVAQLAKKAKSSRPEGSGQVKSWNAE